MILRLIDTKGTAYLIDHGYVADVSPVRRSDYGANAVITDRKGGTHWVTETVEDIFTMIQDAEKRTFEQIKLAARK